MQENIQLSVSFIKHKFEEVMINIENIPSVEKIDETVDNISLCKERVQQIDYDHAFNLTVRQKIRTMSTKYKTIDFNDLFENETGESFEEKNWKMVLKYLFHFAKKILPLLFSLLKDNFVQPDPVYFASIANETLNYYLKTSEFETIKNKLKISRKPKRYKKIRNVIIVSNLSEIVDDKLDYLKFIILLIKRKHIRDCAILILNDNADGIVVELGIEKNTKIELNEDDLEYLFKGHTYPKTAKEILNSIGLEYINYVLFICNDLGDFNEDRISALLRQMIQSADSDINYSEMEYFLKTCSLLFNDFSLIDLERINVSFEKDLKYKQMLPVSKDAHILQLNREFIYTFTEEFFRSYYQELSTTCFREKDYLSILNYLKNEYPDSYGGLALVSRFMPIKNDEKLSYFIMALYHNYSLKIKEQAIVEAYLEKDLLGKELLDLIDFRENYRARDLKDWKYKCYKVIELSKCQGLLDEAQLCILGIVCNVLYEIESDASVLKERFSFYTFYLEKLQVFSKKNSHYAPYILDAIIFSTAMEDYKIQKQANKLVTLLENLDFQNDDLKVKFFKLGNLLYVLNRKKASIFTKLAFELSEDKVILHEEARLNYVVSLLVKREHSLAYDIMQESKCTPKGYELAFENNILIASYLSKKMSKKNLLKGYKKLLKDFIGEPTSDEYIVLNNYLTTLILVSPQKNTKEIEATAEIILKTNDVYHRFYTMYNLLLLYFLLKDKKSFDYIKTEIKVPYLMRNNKKDIELLIQFLSEHFYECSTLEDLEYKLKLEAIELNDMPCDDIIRWGLIERWYK